MIYLRFILLILFFIISGCDNKSNPMQLDNLEQENSSWIFVANEGGFGGIDDGTLTMIDNSGNTIETDILGDTVQSLAVYNNKLIVSVFDNQKLLIFDISESGISNMQEILTDESSPRELIVLNDKLYFGAWDPDYNVYLYEPGNIKVLDLKTLNIDNPIFETIPVGIMPEGMLFDSNYLWVANSGENTISKIDISNNTLAQTIEVGNGPQNLVIHNNDIYISRYFWDPVNYNNTYGSSKISGNDVTNVDYSSGVVCGGAVLNYNNQVYRSTSGGIAPVSENLNLNQSERIGNYNPDKVYHVEIIDNNIWFGMQVLDNNGWIVNEPGTIKIVDQHGMELSSFEAGINPGDFAIWNK